MAYTTVMLTHEVPSEGAEHLFPNVCEHRLMPVTRKQITLIDRYRAEVESFYTTEFGGPYLIRFEDSVYLPVDGTCTVYKEA